MLQIKINKAYPALMRLCEFKLPIKKARWIYNMSNKMREHFEFALAEEKKSVTECHGNMNPDGTATFSNEEDFNNFQNRINELNNSDVEWGTDIIVLTEDDIGSQSISVSDIRNLEGFVIFE